MPIMSAYEMKSLAIPIANDIGPDPLMMFNRSLAYSPNIPCIGGKHYWVIGTVAY